jgi:hypothetical protein
MIECAVSMMRGQDASAGKATLLEHKQKLKERKKRGKREQQSKMGTKISNMLPGFVDD